MMMMMMIRKGADGFLFLEYKQTMDPMVVPAGQFWAEVSLEKMSSPSVPQEK